MLTFILLVLFFAVFGRLLKMALCLGWGMLKIALFLIFLPAAILMMMFGGLVYVALPLIVIAGIAGLMVQA